MNKNRDLKSDNRLLRKKQPIIYLVKVAAFCTIIFSIITLFDDYHRNIELLSPFRFQYLFASAICAIILFFCKSYAFTAVLVLVTALNSAFVAPWYFSDPQNDSADIKADITLLLSNVYTGNTKFRKVIDLVKQEKPDIFVLQEVNANWLFQVRELEDVYRHKYVVPRRDNFGIAMFSKHPFESIKQVKWGPSKLPSIVGTFSIGGQLVTTITTHPLPPVSKRNYNSRNAQIDEIAEVSRNHESPLIVIGDLNITVWSNDYAPLESGTKLRNARKGFGILPTWPSQLPPFRIPIDHCLVSSHFVVHDIKVGDDIGSDHLPLIVKLGLKN